MPLSLLGYGGIRDRGLSSSAALGAEAIPWHDSAGDSYDRANPWNEGGKDREKRQSGRAMHHLPNQHFGVKLQVA